jgi:hypothetical protein
MLPAGSIPTKEEITGFIRPLLSTKDAHRIRDKAVKRFYRVVNSSSPDYAKRAMMALIEFALGDKVGALHSAGFAQCNIEDPNFDKQMKTGDVERALPTILNSEQKKAEVLIQIITERR